MKYGFQGTLEKALQYFKSGNLLASILIIEAEDIQHGRLWGMAHRVRIAVSNFKGFPSPECMARAMSLIQTILRNGLSPAAAIRLSFSTLFLTNAVSNLLAQGEKL